MEGIIGNFFVQYSFCISNKFRHSQATSLNKNCSNTIFFLFRFFLHSNWIWETEVNSESCHKCKAERSAKIVLRIYGQLRSGSFCSVTLPAISYFSNLLRNYSKFLHSLWKHWFFIALTKEIQQILQDFTQIYHSASHCLSKYVFQLLDKAILKYMTVHVSDGFSV